MPALMSPEEREARYRVLAASDMKAAAMWAAKSRESFRSRRLPVPAWAAPGVPGRPRKAPAPRKPAPAPAVVAPLELPLTLRQWRAGSPGRCVALNPSTGVVTLSQSTGPFERQEASFPSAAEAAEAVTPPIKWRNISRALTYNGDRKKPTAAESPAAE